MGLSKPKSIKHNGKRQDERRRMDPDAIDRVVRKYAAALGLDRGRIGGGTSHRKASEAETAEEQTAAAHRIANPEQLRDRIVVIGDVRRVELELSRIGGAHAGVVGSKP